MAQRRVSLIEYAFDMTFDTRTKALAAAWTVAIFVTAFLSQIGSQAGWLIASVVAFGPSLTLLYFCKEPLRTTSERIRDARR
jgi:hypothetical protein